MAAVETGPPCHPFRADSNPVRDNVCGSGRNKCVYSKKENDVLGQGSNELADALHVETMELTIGDL